MKNLFLSTAIVTIGALGSAPYVFADSTTTLSEAEFSFVYEAVNISSVSVGLHTGDFQSIARMIKQQDLYDGAGAALMKTVRLLRY